MTLTKSQQKDTFKALAIATIKITLTGIVIGVFHEHDFWVGLLLLKILLLNFDHYLSFLFV